MQYRLRTLLILLAILPPLLAAAWFLSHSLAGMLAWFGIAAHFGLFYWSLRRSQSLPPETRGKEISDPSGYSDQ